MLVTSFQNNNTNIWISSIGNTKQISHTDTTNETKHKQNALSTHNVSMCVWCVCVWWEGIDQSSLIARFNTVLFLLRAEGYFSPHYSLRQEAETGKEGQGNDSSATLNLHKSQQHTKNTLARLRKQKPAHTNTEPHALMPKFRYTL